MTIDHEALIAEARAFITPYVNYAENYLISSLADALEQATARLREAERERDTAVRTGERILADALNQSARLREAEAHIEGSVPVPDHADHKTPTEQGSME